MSTYVIPGVIGVIVTIVVIYVFELVRSRKPTIIVPCGETLKSHVTDDVIVRCQGAEDHIGVHYGVAGNDRHDVWWSKRVKKS